MGKRVREDGGCEDRRFPHNTLVINGLLGQSLEELFLPRHRHRTRRNLSEESLFMAGSINN